MPELNSSSQKRKYTLSIIVVFLIIIFLTYIWNGLETGLWTGKIVGPSSVSPAGDFFAGTIGVAGTLAAAYLGLVLASAATETAKQTLALQEQQLEATERVQKQEDLAKQAQEETAREIRLQEENARRRQIEMQVVADIEKTLQGIQRLARAYISTLNCAVTLMALGSLRDQQSQKIMQDLAALHGEDQSTWDDVSRKEYAAAEEEYRDMYPFRYADFQDFVVEVNELAEAAEAVFWYKPAHDLVASTAATVAERCHKMLGGSLDSFPPPATDLLGFAQRLQRKVAIADREIMQPVASGLDARAYNAYCSQQLVSQPFELERESRIELICLSNVCYSFWINGSNAVRFTPATEGSGTVRGDGNYNIGLLQMLMLLYSIPDEDLVRSALTKTYSEGLSSDSRLEKDAFSQVLERFDLSFGLTKIRTFVDTNLDKIGAIVFFEVGAFGNSQIPRISQFLEEQITLWMDDKLETSVVVAFDLAVRLAASVQSMRALGSMIPEAASRVHSIGKLDQDEKSRLLAILNGLHKAFVAAEGVSPKDFEPLVRTIKELEA